MPRFCAHLGYQFTEVDLRARFAAAAAAGFTAVEHPAPYSVPAAELAELLDRQSLAWVQFALPMGDALAGGKGYACHPGRESDIDRGLALAVDYAAALGCRRIHAMSGIVPSGVSHRDALATYVANLRRIADTAASHGLEVLVENINSRDVPGYFVDRPSLALDVIALCDRPNIRLLLDSYHATVAGEDLLALIRGHADSLGHVQVADHPGRHEPGTGTIDFATFFDALDRAGYAGWVGCEYLPAGRTQDGLGWLNPYRQAPRES